MDRMLLLKQIELLFDHINSYYHQSSFRSERKKIDRMIYNDDDSYDILGHVELFSSDSAGYATQIIQKGNRGIEASEEIFENISSLFKLYINIFEWVQKNELNFPCICQYISLNVSLLVMLLKYGDK